MLQRSSVTSAFKVRKFENCPCFGEAPGHKHIRGQEATL